MAPVVLLERTDLMDDMLARVNEVQQITSVHQAVQLETYVDKVSPRHVFLGLGNPGIDVKVNKLQITLDMARVFKETVNKSWLDICQLVVECDSKSGPREGFVQGQYWNIALTISHFQNQIP